MAAGDNLDFRYVLQLLNRTNLIDLPAAPKDSEAGHWEYYEGRYTLPTQSVPLEVLYLTSRATDEHLVTAKKRVFKDHQTVVVYAPSLDGKRSTHSKLFRAHAAQFLNTRDFLAKFLQGEISRYVDQLAKLAPADFIQPKISCPNGLEHQYPNPIELFLRAPAVEEPNESSRFAILLAEPGQGKTYLSEYIAATLAERSTTSKVFPIYIESEQWSSMGPDDLESLSKTILHSFKYFKAPIGWIAGNESEFLSVTLNAGLFRIIFDGFDEYVLKNSHRTSAEETLTQLLDLVRKTDARVVVTSRTTFWNSDLKPTATGKRITEQKLVSVYQLQEFDENQAVGYFKNKFPQDQSRVEACRTVYRGLRDFSPGFAGRGFVLTLIYDYVRGLSEPKDAAKGTSVFELLKAFCERDVKRQELVLDAAAQMRAMQTFAAETCQGAAANTETLDFAIELAAPQLDTAGRKGCIDRLGPHGLLHKSNSGGDTWQFSQEQVRIALLANYLVDVMHQSEHTKVLQQFNKEARISESENLDLAEMMLEALRSRNNRLLELTAVARLVREIVGSGVDTRKVAGSKQALRRLAPILATRALDSLPGMGKSHKERSEALLHLLGMDSYRGIHFSGAMTRLDLRGAQFEDCDFDAVRWANCEFDSTTKFARCRFVGGSIDFCQGFGIAQFDNISGDVHALSVIESAQVRDGKKQYSRDFLIADIKSAVDKFIAKGGLGMRSVSASGLHSGRIGASPHRDVILDELGRKLYESHQISQTGDEGFNVRESAIEAVKFYSINNVLTGVLAEALERLVKKTGAI